MWFKNVTKDVGGFVALRRKWDDNFFLSIGAGMAIAAALYFGSAYLTLDFDKPPSRALIEAYRQKMAEEELRKNVTRRVNAD